MFIFILCKTGCIAILANIVIIYVCHLCDQYYYVNFYISLKYYNNYIIIIYNNIIYIIYITIIIIIIMKLIEFYYCKRTTKE